MPNIAVNHLQRPIFIVLTCAILFLLFLSNQTRVRADDDKVYLYTTNYATSEPEAYAAESGKWIDTLMQLGYAAETIARFEFRYDFSRNYFVHSAIFAMVRWLSSGSAYGADYLAWIMYVVRIGTGLVFAGLVVTLGVILAGASRGELLAVFTFVTLLGLASFLPSGFDWRLTNAQSLDEWLLVPAKAMYFLVQPGSALDTFGTNPKNAVTMLLVAVTALRWRNQDGYAYGLLLLAATVHAVYGGIALFLYLGLDLLARPSALRGPHVKLLIVATVSWVSVFGISFESFHAGALAWGMLALATLVAFTASLGPGQVGLERVPGVLWLRTQDVVLREVLVLSVGLLLLLGFSAGLSLMSTGLTRKYVAEELSARPLSLIRVPLGLSVVMLGFRLGPRWFSSAAGNLVPLGAVLVCLFHIVMIIISQPESDSRPNLLVSLPSKPLISPRIATSDEERAVYYAIARTLDFENPATRLSR